MAIHLHRLPQPLPPLHDVSELLMEIPEEGSMVVANSLFKLIFVLHGSAHLLIDGEDPYQLGPGDLLVLPLACQQRYRRTAARGPGHLHVLLLQYQTSGQVAVEEQAFTRLLREVFTRPRHLKAGSCRELRRLSMKLRETGETDGASHRLLAEIARQFVIETIYHAGIARAPSLPSPWDRAERLAVQALHAERGNLERSPLIRPWLGMSMHRYRNLLRIEEAKRRMVYQIQPIATLSRQLGFSSPGVFSRSFQSFAGCSPKEYQQRLQPHFASGQEVEPWGVGEVEIWEASASWKAARAGVLFCLQGRGTLSRKVLALSAHEADALLIPKGAVWSGNAQLAFIPLEDGIPRAPKLVHLSARRELEVARAAIAEGGEIARLYGESLLRVLAYEITRGPLTQPVVRRLPHRLPTDYAVEYLRKHYAGPICLSDVAWFSGVSEEHLARTFRQVHGRTVMDYLRDMRLERAAHLLKDGTETVTAIARRCGFGNVALLCREFRKAYGCTPIAYRRDCKE